MDDDVQAAFHAVSERFKRLEASLKAEVDERMQLRAELNELDTGVTQIKKSLGAWIKGELGKKVEDVEKHADLMDKRLDAIEKRVPKR